MYRFPRRRPGILLQVGRKDGVSLPRVSDRDERPFIDPVADLEPYAWITHDVRVPEPGSRELNPRAIAGSQIETATVSRAGDGHGMGQAVPGARLQEDCLVLVREGPIRDRCGDHVTLEPKAGPVPPG